MERLLQNDEIIQEETKQKKNMKQQQKFGFSNEWLCVYE